MKVYKVGTTVWLDHSKGTFIGPYKKGKIIRVTRNPRFNGRTSITYSVKEDNGSVHKGLRERRILNRKQVIGLVLQGKYDPRGEVQH